MHHTNHRYCFVSTASLTPFLSPLHSSLLLLLLLLPCGILYPFSVNSTYNVGIPQQRRIQEELVRAAYLSQDETNWRALYSPSDFFERHGNFLQISIRAGKNTEDFTKWLRLCESRLRLLVGALDCPEMSVWPFAQVMKREYTPEEPSDTGNALPNADPSKSSSSSGLQEALFFIGLRFAPNVEIIDLKHHTSEFLINQINSWEGRKPDMDFMIHHVLQKDLPHDLISDYVVTKPSPFEIPNPMFRRTAVYNQNSNSYMTQNINNTDTDSNQIATTTTKAGPSGIPQVPREIRGASGGDNNSVARSTYSSIARSVNSSMPSEDGMETTVDGIELESRPQSPLGNLITVEGGPHQAQQTYRSNTDGQTKERPTSTEHRDGSKHTPHQAQLYEFLTGKIDDLVPGNRSNSAAIAPSEVCTDSQSDQSSTRSPIKKRPRNRSGSNASQQSDNA